MKRVGFSFARRVPRTGTLLARHAAALLVVFGTVPGSALKDASAAQGRPSTATHAKTEVPTFREAAARTLADALGEADSNPRAAAAKLDALRTSAPWLADVAACQRAGVLAKLDRAGAERAYEEFLEREQDSFLVPDAAAALAALVERRGDAKRAAALADRYGRAGKDGPEAAATCLAAGRLLLGKDPARALPYLQCARSRAPLSDAARTAWQLTQDAFTKDPGLAPSTAEARMSEARLLARENRPSEQLTLLRRVLAEHPGGKLEEEAVLAYGRGLGRNASKAEGAAFLEEQSTKASGATKAKLLYEAGTLRWNDDHNDQAVTLFQAMLSLKTGIGDEQQAMYALGRIHDAAGRREEAIAWYSRAATAAAGAARAESRWRRGWVSYRAAAFDDARKSFAAMAESAPRGSDVDGRADALYWQARSMEKLGQRREAGELLADVMQEFPLGYYAAAAEKRLGRRAPQPAVARIRQPSSARPGALPAAANLALRRAETLRQAGLASLAARDLSARLATFDAATRIASLPALPSAGAWDAAFRIAAEMSEKGNLSREEARAYLYPLAWRDTVEQEAKAAGIDPVLVWALMRQESAFSPTAVSSAKAVGLLQLLEKTARRVAAASGLPEPSAEELFDPAVNIRLGVRYLAELSQRFHGNAALMAAAYNAGETAADRWQLLSSRYEEDEVIEQISYRETRLYVKSILRNMRNYRMLYGNDAAVDRGT